MNNYVHLQMSAQMKTEDVGEVAIYGIIYPYKYNETITSKEMRETLAKVANAKKLNIHINSPGGIVSEAVDIMGQIKEHPAKEKNVFISLCCSAATLIPLAATHTAMYEGGDFMIHRPMSGLFGNADDLANEAQALAAKEKEFCRMYAAKCKQPEEDVWEKMQKETWFTAKEAKDYGFVDEVIKITEDDGKSMLTKGQMLMLGYKQVPETLLQRLPEKEQGPEKASGHGGEMLASPVAGGNANETAAAAALSDIQQKGENTTMTTEELRKQHPELVAEIEQAAMAAERKRIQDIDEVALPGYEEMAADAKFKNPVDAATFSMQQTKAMKAKGPAFMQQRMAETQTMANIKPDTPPAGSSAQLEAAKEDEAAKMCAAFARDRSTVKAGN